MPLADCSLQQLLKGRAALPGCAGGVIAHDAAGAAGRALHALADADVLHYTVQIAAGIRQCHEAGMVVKDLKPANVLVKAAGGSVVPDVWGGGGEGAALVGAGAAAPTVGPPSFFYARRTIAHRTNLGSFIHPLLRG